jgi:DNA-binding NarL/FixJ family response regulator
MQAGLDASLSARTLVSRSRHQATAARTERKSRASRPSTSRQRRKVLVVDDHPIVRLGLRRLIDQQRDLAFCAEAETREEAEAAIRKHRPDLIIIDISLKHGDGIELVKDTRAHYPTLPILVLSMHDEAIYAERVLSAGANGYLMKQAAPDLLLLALRRVLGGGMYVSDAIGSSMLRRVAEGGRHVVSNPIERLSNRELQVLQMIGSGMSTREAAAALKLSTKTVESHRERIKHKLHLTTGSQLVQYAVNWSEKSDSGMA